MGKTEISVNLAELRALETFYSEPFVLGCWGKGSSHLLQEAPGFQRRFGRVLCEVRDPAPTKHSPQIQRCKQMRKPGLGTDCRTGGGVIKVVLNGFILKVKECHDTKYIRVWKNSAPEAEAFPPHQFINCTGKYGAESGLFIYTP